MTENTFLKKFLEDPAILDQPQSLSIEDKKALLELEETLVSFLQSAHAGSQPIDDENEFAARAEELIASGKLPEGMNLQAALQVVRSIEIMGDNLRYQLPEALRHIVQTASKKSPSIYVKVGHAGISFLKSTLQGFAFKEEALAEVRSSAAAEKSARVSLTHRLPGGELEYQLVRDSDEHITMSLHLPASRGFQRALLKREGKLIASHNVDLKKETVVFDRISAGNYSVELPGPQNVEFTLVIEKE